MATKDQSKTLDHKKLDADEQVLTALTQIPNYTAVNPVTSVKNLTALHADWVKSREAKSIAEAALLTANDHHNNAGWAFHNAVLLAKAQVRAQFGSDSVELQSLGLKRTSERKRPASKKAKT